MAAHEVSTNVLHLSYVPFPAVGQITQSVPAAEISQADFIEDFPEERDETAWQDFLTYCAEVQS